MAEGLDKSSDQSAQTASNNMPKFLDQAHAFLASPHFQSALQLTVGMFIMSLFIFVDDMKYYYNACLATTLFIVNSVTMAQDNHVGTKFMASAFLLGSAMLGITFAGIMLTISKSLLVYKGPKPPRPLLPQPRGPPKSQPLGAYNFSNFGLAESENGPYIALSCVLAVVTIGIISINRVADKPAFLWVLGMVGSLVSGLVFIDGLYVPTSLILWTVNLRYLLINVCLASAVTLAVALLLLPTYASSEARAKACAALAATGQSIGRSVHTLATQEAEKESTDTGAQDAGADQGDEEELYDPEMDIADDAFLEMLKTWSEPVAPLKKSSSKASIAGMYSVPPGPPPGPPPASFLRPLLARAQMCAVASQAEPLWLQPQPLSFGPFMGLLAALDDLVGKASALESLLEEPDVSLTSMTRICGPEHDALLVFRRIMQDVSDQCSVLSQALANPQAPVKSGLVRTPDWEAASKEVGAAISHQLKIYWGAVRAKKLHKMARVKDVRTLMLFVSISYGILESLIKIERLAAAVRAGPGAAPPQPPAPTPGKGDVELGTGDATKPPTSPPQGPPPASGPPKWVAYWFGWFIFLLPLITMLPAFHNLFEVLFKKVPAALSSRKAFASSLKSRYFQAWVKYWLGLSVLLVLVIAIGYKFPSEARLPPPLFGYLATTLALSEKVEATVSKIVLWVGGTVVGGTLGYVVMLRPGLADNPYGLMALICAFTFIVGMVGPTQLRVSVTLTLMTFCGLVLCQFHGWCREGGDCHDTRLRTYLSRMLAVSFGALWAAGVTNLVLPWYNSSWALKTLGDAYITVPQAMKRGYLQFYKKGHQTAMEHERVHGSHFVSSVAKSATDMAAAHPDQEPLSNPEFDAPLPPFIKENVEARITAVQVSLQKDAAFWNKGILATPRIVPRVLSALQVELDRLSMLSMALGRHQASGQFNGWVYRLLLEGMHPNFIEVVDRLQDLADVVGDYMSGGRHDSPVCKDLERLLSDLDAARLKARHQLIVQRKALYHSMLDAPDEDIPYLMNVDDSVAFMSFLGSYIKCLDKAESVARLLAQDGKWECGKEWVK